MEAALDSRTTRNLNLAIPVAVVLVMILPVPPGLLDFLISTMPGKQMSIDSDLNAGLITTRAADETLSFGPLLNETLRTRWPISLLGTGQSVPEDLVPATRDMLADLVLRRELPLAEGERKRA